MIKKMFVATAILFFLIFIIYDYGPEGRVYDCSLAEISADIPIQVKEECRKLQRDIENQLQREKKLISV
jgi:hypothetical protein